MKFEQFLNRESVPEWRPKYLNYHLLKDHLRAIPLNQQNPQLESAFFADCRQEIIKASHFYSDKQRELLIKYNLFKSTLSKRDLINLYTEIDFLKNFQLLNSTALKKILKKFVKVTGNFEDVQKFQNDVCDLWNDPKALDKLSTDIEELFTLKYANSDRHRAMRRLRLRNFKNETFYTSAWFAGLFWGISSGVLVYNSFFYSKSELFYTFTSQLIPFIALGVFSINSLVFKRSFVNYQFVFQFDKRTSLHESQFALFTGFLSFVLLITWLIIFIIDSHKNTSKYLALLPLIVVLIVFLNPSLWPWPSSRIWMLKTLLRIVSAPLFPVVFKDFFINDHLISQTYFLQGILKSFAVNQNNFSVKLIGILPNLTRTLQCLRRYKDSKIRLNLLNASKYSLVIIVIILRATIQSGIPVYIVQACSTLFSLYWDLVMDFGLLQSTRDFKKLILRDQLVVFPYKSVYYYMIFFNCISRFSWILLNYNILSIDNTQLLIALIEILRRFHWTFLRIEYEHLNNCNLFKAVEELKLPEIDSRTADLFYKDMVSESRILENEEEGDGHGEGEGDDNAKDSTEDIYYEDTIMESSV